MNGQVSATRDERALRPHAGEAFLFAADEHGELWAKIGRPLRQNDTPSVWSIMDGDRCLRFVRYDRVRGAWVNAATVSPHVDGGPVRV